jgi:nucleotide-binding universal stress UspA family protein
MSCFDVLVHLRDFDGDSLAARTAYLLARRLPCHLYGLYVAPMGVAAFSTPETVVFEVQEADRLYREALARESWWREQLTTQSLRGEWLVAQGDAVDALCHAARWCDFIVAERPVLRPDAPTGWGTVSRTVFGAGVPVVVVPQTARVASLGECVLVAWNQSREAMRAIHGALPLLRHAREIVVLDGQTEDERLGARHLPRLDLAAYFERHGIRTKMRPFAPHGGVGPAILAAAHEFGADLVVMGAWGHSRIAELVLGGVTRHLFQHSDLPLLVAH